MAYKITLTSVLLAAPASMSAPSELSAKATSTRLTRTLASLAVLALALAPLALLSRVKSTQNVGKQKGVALWQLPFVVLPPGCLHHPVLILGLHVDGSDVLLLSIVSCLVVTSHGGEGRELRCTVGQWHPGMLSWLIVR